MGASSDLLDFLRLSGLLGYLSNCPISAALADDAHIKRRA
jgi:hypothetical protein